MVFLHIQNCDTPACNVTAIIVCNIAYEKNTPNCKTSDIYQTFSLA